ncbi:putative P-loop containing nucleoside triphosphate hydrolase, leucine-rich repeat domain, L [Medicago truncatula]|uniref:Disease resistance protein (CC-NBS-LRR class) family protein n=1 Tax=Medicago truncatula TaxID=3880 RepID=A0A072UTR4_MEDTR|nr:putative disease resistance RPP13-like protein 1 [Medicago truncatula]KEH33017.1 disease resistance protein (CC-NBS-LRR class) family protein [Medicago truncatula]RHN65699.1 putative P-loop containing nucleoside triphosphate hydrolase, leucine-rich repeat domain, L [Medicago truncatula]
MSMAELVGGAFLSSFFQVALEKLSSNDFIDYFRGSKLDDKLLEKLLITLNSINRVLEEAEMKQYQSMSVKKWLDDLKHNAYEVDQLLDEIATDAPLKKQKFEPSTSKVFNFFSSFINPFESRIKELLEKLEFLAKQKDMLGLKQDTCASSEGGLSWKPLIRFPTTSLVDGSSIYGRNGDKEELVNFLLSDIDSGNQVPIISIVGLGGMGKTTLAQLVYNDRRMKEHFELKAWVYVSETFDVVGLTKAILRSFHSSTHAEEFNLLQHQLQHKLTGKKYLLVLDDVWNGNEEGWERLLLPLCHGSTGSGSKIIVTTRDKEVASIMKSTKELNLEKLNESECWRMFVRHAFHGRNASEYPNLVSIGKKIVDKCVGFPLAVKTLGNLLRRKFSQREWVRILETDMWHLSEGDNNINSVLRLSYHHLPSILKRCFSYCSIFPKGHIFDKRELIKLWIADGLLKCCGSDKSEEELGNELFVDLESISFFQKSIHDDKRFVMHNLINDLAKSMVGEFCLQIEDDKERHVTERTRHIWCSLQLKDGDKMTQHIYKIKGLRSLMAQGGFGGRHQEICNTIQQDLFSKLKCLRMLSLKRCNLQKLDDKISNLKLMRYLDLSLTKIKRLPDSICNLYNLQTLLLAYCPLTELPSDFYKLTNLRHLDLEGTLIKKMPKEIGRLNHLQTLTKFVVVKDHGSDIKELTELNQLQGKLCISGLENVIIPADALEAKLKDKKHLEELHIIYSAYTTREINNEMSVLEALQPNSNLNNLTIEHYRGTSFPNWIRDFHLSSLVSLNLKGCQLCSQLPPFEKFPYLNNLCISSCPGIEIINSIDVPFRFLEILRFEDMSNWKEWLCVEGFPLLKELSIRNCPKLTKFLPQHLPSLQGLVIIDCQELEVSIPKASNIGELQLVRCENILVNDLPSKLTSAVLYGNQVIASYLEQILFNNAFLKRLNVGAIDSANLEWSSLDLPCYKSLGFLSIRNWHSSFPFSLHLFTNLKSLYLYDCPQLESFPRKATLPA